MNSIFKSFTAFLIGVVLVFSSCQKEDTDPSTDARDNYEGSWSCVENSSITGTNPTFTVKIVKGSGDDEIVFQNFYALGNNNSATAVIDANNFTINQQTVAGNTVKGSGNLQGPSAIFMTYSVFDGSTKDSVTATLSRQ
ncbi:MAG: hypothetical protein J0M08_01320 [Bacteroidetes bacterium]|nr:hypothetical protein [Bacteroidota bacterium]